MSNRFLLTGLFFSLAWHFFWVVGLVPVLSSGRYEKVGGRAIYAGAVLKPDDFLPARSKTLQRKNAFGVPAGTEAVLRPTLDKVEGYAPKPEVRFTGLRLSAAAPGPIIERPALKKNGGGTDDLTFGMSDYGRYLYQADFSDLKRAARHEELSHAIVFQVFLDDGGCVAHIKKISGSGDPSLDLFILSKISNAVFKPDVAPRGRWFAVHFSLR